MSQLQELDPNTAPPPAQASLAPPPPQDDVLRAQERLSKALTRARALEDRELALRVRHHGEQLVRLMTALLRMTRFHDLYNHAFDDPLRDAERALRDILELLGSTQIVMVDEQVFVNDLRVRFSAENDFGAECGKLWHRHDVGAITFHHPMDETQWRVLVRLVMSDPPTDRNARAALREALALEGLTFIELQPPLRLRLRGEEDVDTDASAGAILNRADRAVGTLWDQVALGRLINPVRLRRAVNELVDIKRPALDEMLSETVLNEDPKPFVRHSLSVASLAILIGRTLGMSNEMLADLGLSACFHDLGYAVDEDGVAPPFERHGSSALRRLLDERGLHDARVRRLRVCLEHHRPFNHPRRPSLYARIVHIADDYDTLTRRRGRRPLLSPTDAIGRMYAASGAEYDPVLLQLFVNAVGRYPPGTQLQLDDGTWVRVIGTARNAATFERPVCVVTRTPQGAEPDEPTVLDLAETRHTVLRVLG